MNLLTIVGTRPNFIKITQFKKAADQFSNINVKIAHTGQHSDHKMANVFFDQFDLRPDVWLDIPQSTPNTQMAEIMLRIEREIDKQRPDLIVVVGDVNSTFAAALTANKMGVKLAHVESGLRSGDKTMPEEVNRMLTDQVADFYFITEQSGIDNLSREGLTHNQFLVGNTMIDTLVAFEKEIQKSSIRDKLQIEKGEYILMTIHRPATVDNEKGLKSLIHLISEVVQHGTVVFPIHPRSVDRLKHFCLFDQMRKIDHLTLIDPLDYFSFQKLIADCKLVITDSGGIQEETTYRQIPCLTLRPSTERPVTVDIGTNELIDFNTEKVIEKIDQIQSGKYKKGEIPPLWDGKATQRIMEVISKLK